LLAFTIPSLPTGALSARPFGGAKIRALTLSVLFRHPKPSYNTSATLNIQHPNLTPGVPLSFEGEGGMPLARLRLGLSTREGEVLI